MPPLLSRALDPFLGVFTGIFAYYLYETNPRTAFPAGHKLPDLLRWKWLRWRREREGKLSAAEAVEWQRTITAAESK